jgi:serine/threonine-protein kinase
MADIDAHPRRPFSLPLAIKFFLGCAFLIALAVGAAVVVTYLKGVQVAARAVDSALATSSGVQKEFEQNRLEQLQLKVQLFAADPSTAKYVAQVGGSNLPGLSDGADRDSLSITDLLKERSTQYGFDLGIVLDAKGNVLGRSDQTEAFRESLADDPLVRPAVEKAAPFSGYWRQGDKLYQAAVMPLQQDQSLVGFVLLAQTVSNELCRQIAKTSEAQIAFWMPSDGPSGTEARDGQEGSGDGINRQEAQPGKRLLLVASSLDESSAKALQDAAAAQGAVMAAIAAGHSMPRIPLSFSGQSWIAQLTPTAAEGEAKLGGVLSLTSSDRIVASYRDILNWVLIGGVLSIVIALLLSYLLAKGIVRPVRTMAAAAEQAAAGNYSTRVGLHGSDELARLSQAFDSLLSDLREKSDIEGYVGNLSRFLPDPGAEAVRAVSPVLSEPPPREPTRRGAVALLGLEFREFGDADADNPKYLMAGYEHVVRIVEEVTRAAGGSVHGLLGPRLVVRFFGTRRLQAALQAWSMLYKRLCAEEVGLPAAALVTGDVVHGQAGLDDKPHAAVLGAAMLQLDRLLPEAAPGQMMVAAQAGDEVREELGADALTQASGIATSKQFYAFDVAALARVPAPAALGQAKNGAKGETIVSADGRADGLPQLTPRTGARLATTLAIGSDFGGRYRILAELGSGGMGVVYKAHDLELGDIVALKMLKPGALVDGEQLDRLKSEIRLARRITHPNVLRTFDFGEVEGRPFISMEYVRGLTLRYLLNETRRMPYSAGLRIARQLCAGLAAAHEVGVLHRDIKPENLILEQTGNAKLMDFGIARPIRRSAPDFTHPGTFVGTPHYSAPEQLAGADVDQRADIYASGVLMCEMFCGKLPFSGGNTLEIYIAQMQQEPIKPSAIWPEIPPALDTIILRCLNKAPADRYASASDLAQALASLRA